jgi:hypothetical protein
MTTTSRTRSFGFTSILLLGAVALAATASGCVIDNGNCGGAGSDLFVDWQIQNSAGAPVTCGGAGAATVVVTVDKVDYPQTCVSTRSSSSIDVPLQGSGTYDVTVSLYDATGNSLAPSQSISVDVNSCGSYATPSPALLVVSPPAQS